MHVGTIMESNDATFFEDIFPMKDMATSSNQEMPSLSNQESITNAMKSISQENTIHGLWSKLALLWNWHIDFRQTTPGSQIREF